MGDARGAAVANRSTVGAVIPAYFEQRHIADVVERTRRHLDHVLVVDDGSTDDTAANARGAGAEVIVHKENKGKGEAINTGLRHWQERNLPYALVLDGDGQHLPEEIERFLAAAAGGAQLIVGTRMSDTRTMPLVRRLTNRYMSRRISRVCGQDIPDTQCGFRMLHASVIPDLLTSTGRFEYETEMLIKVSRKGGRIDSVPVSTVYCDEVSSIHPLRDSLRFLKLIRRYEKA